MTTEHAPHLVRYTVGIGFDAAEFVATKLRQRKIEGATILDGSGYWTNPDTGEVVSEPAQVLILTHTSPDEFGFQMATVLQWGQDAGEHTIMVEHHSVVEFVPTATPPGTDWLSIYAEHQAHDQGMTL